jgi:hypothetical protein
MEGGCRLENVGWRKTRQPRSYAPPGAANKDSNAMAFERSGAEPLATAVLLAAMLQNSE